VSVPHPLNGVLYLKLRDDPETVQTLTLPVKLVNAPASATAPAQAQPAPTTLPTPPVKSEP
jgi:hypothetical protein